MRNNTPVVAVVVPVAIAVVVVARSREELVVGEIHRIRQLVVVATRGNWIYINTNIYTWPAHCLLFSMQTQ